MNSLNYQDALNNTVVPFFASSQSQGYTFMHDNASIHAGSATNAYLQAIPVMTWPACGPDINLIENIWEYLVRHVYAGGKQYSTVNELKIALIFEWKSLDSKYL